MNDLLIPNEIIRFKLNDIFGRLFHINIYNICDNYGSEDLLGKKFGLKARDLLYLFFEIEKEFSVIIIQDNILKRDLQTLDRITNMIIQLQQ